MKDLRVRYPLSLKLVISMVTLCLLFLWTYLINGDRDEYGNLIISVVCGGILVFALVRGYIKPKILAFQNQSLKVGNTILYAKDIKHIYIERTCIIGIRPRNKRITPMALTLKIIGTNEDKFLIDWAEKNKVEIKYQTFIKWI